jgi:hypothetical protein
MSFSVLFIRQRPSQRECHLGSAEAAAKSPAASNFGAAFGATALPNELAGLN